MHAQLKLTYCTRSFQVYSVPGWCTCRYCDYDHVVVYERGKLKILDTETKVNVGPKYSHTDTMAVRRQGEDVQYLFNGTVIRTCGHKLNGEIFADGETTMKPLFALA